MIKYGGSHLGVVDTSCEDSCYFGLLSKSSETWAAVQSGVKLSAQQVRNVPHSLTDNS